MAVATIYAAISATVATSVIITIEGLGFRISLASEITYGVIVASDVTILALSASRVSTVVRRIQEIAAMPHQTQGAASSEKPYEVVQLNERQQLVMHAIQRMGGTVMQNSLAEATGISPPTLSRIIASLESMGLIEKRRKGMTNEIRIVRR